MSKVGLLFDSVSNNTGDNAIGIVMTKFLEKKGIKSEIVDPLNYDPDDYALMIIGGGLLIRENGDWFYDSFRLKGRHILNPSGIQSDDDLEYLNDYELVAVRSSAEKSLIEKNVRNARVVPCVAVLMEKDETGIPNFQNQPVGIHITPSMLMGCQNLVEIIKANIGQEKVFMPFTHYMKDKSLMENINRDPSCQVLPELAPQQLFGVIGKMDYIITGSLHAAIFAFAQNIPFLVHDSKKIRDYFRDRGLEHLLFKNDADLAEGIRFIQNNRPDFSSLIDKDKLDAERHLEMIKRIIETRLTDKEKYQESQPIQHQNQTVLKSKIKKKALELMHLKRIIEQRERLILQLKVRSRSVVPQKNSNNVYLKLSDRIQERVSKKESLPSKATFILLKDGPVTFIRCLKAYLKKGSGYAASERWIPRDISKKSYDDLNDEVEYLKNIISRKDKEIGNLLSIKN